MSGSPRPLPKLASTSRPEARVSTFVRTRLYLTLRNDKPIPKKVEKLVYQEANSSCAFCEERDVATLEIHHINPRVDGGGNEPENLLLVCSNCHGRITSADISVHEVYNTKLRLQRAGASGMAAREVRPASNVINFRARSNSGIVANNLRIHTTSSGIKIQPPPDTLSSDRDRLNYIKHLIDRYNEFKKSEPSTADFSYAVIYGTIKREFKCDWKLIPLGKFHELASYLQNRIDRTWLGKINKTKGRRNYRSFDEYLLSMK